MTGLPGQTLQKAGERRETYIQALEQGDKGDLDALMKFCW